jgi:hypothetical protein
MLPFPDSQLWIEFSITTVWHALNDERKIVVSFGSRCISSAVDDSRVATTERFASETGGRQQEFQRRCYVRHMTILTIGIAIAVSR